jgi:hypothetical protein
MVKETKFYDVLGVRSVPDFALLVCRETPVLTRAAGLSDGHRGRVEEGIQEGCPKVPSG